MYTPAGVFVDSAGNAWVADNSNNRVIMFSPPFTNGMNASLVLGQTTFTTNVSATTQSGMYIPVGVSVDSAGNAWVADEGNNRVIMFAPPFTNGMNAGATSNSEYSSVVYPRKNLFYNPKAGLVKL